MAHLQVRVPEVAVGARAQDSRLAGFEYVSPKVPVFGPLKPLAVLVEAPHVHLANSFALDVAFAPLNEQRKGWRMMSWFSIMKLTAA